jgi:hypothetical protein
MYLHSFIFPQNIDSKVANKIASSLIDKEKIRERFVNDRV